MVRRSDEGREKGRDRYLGWLASSWIGGDGK